MTARHRAHERRRRTLAHQCPACRRHWALRVVNHPSGSVLVCRHCGTARTPEPVSLADRSG